MSRLAPVNVHSRRHALGTWILLPLLLLLLLAFALAGCGGGGGKSRQEGVLKGGILTGVVALTDKTWHCKGPVSLDRVEVKIHDQNIDAVHLDSGCTGVIKALDVSGTGGDGVKIHAGAYDLDILGGRVDCGPKAPKRHQDAIQAMGGKHITFNKIESSGCANSFMFINWGKKKREKPIAIVCRDCRAETNNYSVSVRNSIDSGAIGGDFTSRVAPKATAAAESPVLSEDHWTPRTPATSPTSTSG